MKPNNEYSASWDGFVWGVTLFTIALLGCLAVGLLWLMPKDEGVPTWVGPVMAVGLWLIPLITLFFVPRGYVLTDQGLVVRRFGRDIEVGWGEMTMIEPRDVAWWKSLGVRVWGDGGLFGYAGLFWTRGLGTVKVSATRLDRLVVVHQRRGRPLIISPDEREAFIEAAQQRLSDV